MARVPRLAVWSLTAGVLLAGCTPPTAPVAAAPARPAQQLAQQPGGPDMSTEGLQTFMFGPPPRTQLDPLIRCRVKCPAGQQGAAVR